MLQLETLEMEGAGHCAECGLAGGGTKGRLTGHQKALCTTGQTRCDRVGGAALHDRAHCA
jgi:hypothetical protein